MSARKKIIAIIRGGKDDYYRSMKNGENVIISLLRYSDLINVVDVVLDENINWFERGIPSDPHKVFSKADYYIDFTNNKFSEYHNLSKKLDVKPVFKNDYTSILNRGNMKRILEQLKVEIPKYTIIRSKENLENTLKSIWSKFHTPIVIKETRHEFNDKSIITYSFIEAFNKIKKILNKGGEALVEEHVHGKYISTVVIPEYRGEELYMTTPIEILNVDITDKNTNSKSLNNKCIIGHNCEKKSLVFINENIKNDIKNIAKELHKSLFMNHYSMIDMVLLENRKNGHKNYILKILDIHISPNIFEDSRFDFILKNSGVDLGRFIIDRIEKLEEEKKAF